MRLLKVLSWFLFGFFLASIAGCSSGIKTYDSTFTALVPSIEKSSSSLQYTAGYRSSSFKLPETETKLKKPYFIEFRARNALTYGHAYVLFGALDKKGKVPVDKKGVLIPGALEISGLHPASNSTIPWTVGHVVPVPAETGPSDGDFEEAYTVAQFRIDLTERQFRKVVEIVHKHKKQGVFWLGPIYACVQYINAIAKDLQLDVPQRPHLPRNYVEALARLNKGKEVKI